jgi:hypothetical protein
MKRMLIIGLAAIMLLTLVPSVAFAANGGPEGSLTGGGQITTGNGKSEYKVSFAGNVGLMEDESLVGHWQTHFHNVSVNSLDKAKFQSTSITLLAFYYDSTPLPSPAGANVVHFVAEGRLNGEDGYSLDVWLADRGEPGKMIDAIWMELWYGGAVQYCTLPDFPSDAPGPATLLTHGNFQIDS